MDDEDLTPRWVATCLYNGMKTGAGRAVTLIVQTDDPNVAIREAWMAAMRKDGASICITGLSAVELPREPLAVQP